MVVKEKTDTKRHQKESAGPQGQQAIGGWGGRRNQEGL